MTEISTSTHDHLHGKTGSISGSCCSSAAAEPEATQADACCPPANKTDWLLWICGSITVVGYLVYLLVPERLLPETVFHFSHSIFEFLNVMWWGVLLGIVLVGILGTIPREIVVGALGRNGGLSGILRATGAGLAFDLCNHGILLVGLRLYERGLTIGQTMAFLIASPWNSLSLTVILIALIGLKWTLVFIVLSAVIAVVSGLIFDGLVARGTLPENPHREKLGPPKPFMPGLKEWWRSQTWSVQGTLGLIREGFGESRMILRWLFLGLVVAALIRVLMSPETFSTYFGPTMLGLFLTLLATTILEVCSEGSSPVAADLINRASAPGNAFTFLMAGAATDYTEIMGIKERTASWKIALFLPLVTVPQVLVLGYILNMAS